MAKNGNDTVKPQTNKPSHMPEDSVFFEKVIPVLLIFMGLVMVGLLVYAIGIILGWFIF